MTNNNMIFTKYIRNHSKKEKEKFGYLHRLTVLNTINEDMVKIEFSASKLIFNNNFDELEDRDFNLVISALHEKLKKYGSWNIW